MKLTNNSLLLFQSCQRLQSLVLLGNRHELSFCHLSYRADIIMQTQSPIL